MKRDIFPVLVSIFLFLPGFAVADTIIDESNYYIDRDAVWSKEGSPYIINSSMVVDKSAALKIESGTVVKFNTNTDIYVTGRLDAQGTPTEPIIFTSIKDDSVGGDTDGDGGIDMPGNNDIWGLDIGESAQASLSYIKIRYSSGGVFAWASNVVANNLDIENSGQGIGMAQGGTLVVENSVFKNIGSYVLAAYAGSNLSVTNSSVENVVQDDAVIITQGSHLIFKNSQVLDSGNYEAVGIYGGQAEIDNSKFSGDSVCGLILTMWDDYKSNLKLTQSTVENYLTGICAYDGEAHIEGSIIKNNGYGLWANGSYTDSISNSSLFDNIIYAIESHTDNPVDAKNNWWGDTSGPYEANKNPEGWGDEITGSVEFEPWLAQDPNAPAQTTNPVIIIPGIVGTELYDGSDLIWLDLSQMFTDINDQFLTENLNLDTNGNSLLSTIQPKNIIEEIKFTIPVINKEVKIADCFRSLITGLENNNYKKDQTYFVFPYDWRLDLNETKDLLKQKIEEIKTQTGAQKVNIIAHSMGGLLVKDYLNQYGKESVDKLIFVGTPHLGAPKAAKTLLEGDRFGIPWLEEDRIKEIAQNSPALHELLPSQIYFNEFQGYFRKYSLFSTNPLMNYEETKNFFLNDKNENPVMFQKAESFYNQNLDTFDFNGIETYNIAGCKTPTQAAYSFGIFGEIGQTGYTSGDGTVPMVSADYINIPSSNKFYIKDGSHAELPSASGARDLILGILKNNVGNLADNVSNDSSFCNFKGKKLTWHSPVEIHIYDKNGNHTGPIENNAIEYGVSGIDYDVIGHNKFIFLPTDNMQEYLVEAKGLGEGSFDLSVSEIDNGQYLTTQVFNDVPITTTAVASFVVNNSYNNSIELKDGGVTKEVPVDATLNGEIILDLTSPETTAKTDWVKDKKSKLNKNLQVTLTATDNESGVLETAYSLDEGNTFNIYSKPIIVDKKIDEILFYSIDKAGNNEEVKEFDLENNKPQKCKSWKCLDIDKKHNKIKKEYKKIKDHEQEIIKKFKNLKLRKK